MGGRVYLKQILQAFPLWPLLLPRFYIFFALLFTLHHSPLSERLEQAMASPAKKKIGKIGGFSLKIGENRRRLKKSEKIGKNRNWTPCIPYCDVLRQYVSQNIVAITGTLRLNRITLLY